MKYSYQSKSHNELEALAKALLARFPSANNGRPDLEELVESLGVSIIPRPGLAKLSTIAGYVPRLPNLVLVDAGMAATDMAHYRVTLAEELAHLQLEPELWQQGIPVGANIYEIDKTIYDDIESDAYNLAVALLLPEVQLRAKFAGIYQEMVLEADPKEVDWLTVATLAAEFIVPLKTCAYRCRMLKLCNVDVHSKPLPGALVF